MDEVTTPTLPEGDLAEARAREAHETGDFHVWTQQQATLLRARRGNEIDWDGIAEEIESLGRRDRQEVVSRLIVLVMHLLKWRFQPGARSNSWVHTINEQRRRIGLQIEDSPSLGSVAATGLARAYAAATRDAARETGLPPATFPAECPFTLDEILDPDYWPLPLPEDAP